ncbi:thermonuclease family protein [Coriobacteriia bacterium Es71-Z0120]|uniref:thermonuclease family protein n=1 Tax=Parvivirga hydrogeniphila TaxID=2939460 RepID=UPI00226103F3|nr:thermonuclease family protein [Parvivirga hydrogeniphila]MCL4078076.1 thermonuclease family protein [Parvivirga hydrogeniphila]
MLTRMRGRAAAAAALLVVALALAGCEPQAVWSPEPSGGSAAATPPAAAVATASDEPSLPAYTGDGGDAGIAAVEATEAVVVRVVDGDTAVFRLADGRQEKVRFIGVDTPESTIEHEPYGAEASAYTKRLLPRGRRVWLETDAGLRDRYGRLLAYVWLALPTGDPAREARSKMLNARLALDGYATQMTVPPNVRYAHVFAACVEEARSAGRGLWGIEPR